MDTAQLALLALLIGVILGGSVALVVIAAYRARDRAIEHGSTEVPDGVRDVLAGMDDPAVVLNPSGTVLAASIPAAAYGFAEGAVPPSDDVLLLANAARVGTATDAATLRLPRAGEERVVSVRARPITSRLVLVVLRDVTEQERVEQMRRDFVANTSHELKTPVGAVSLLAEAIDSAADDPAQVRAFAKRLLAEATRLGTLTTRIMSLSRLQSEQPAAMRDVAVDELVVAAIAAHATQADSAGVEIRRGGERGAYVHGDPQVLGEAVGNLLANAIAYSPRGSHVGIGVRVVDRVVELAVSDQGVGIAEADQERVFERFYRADQARSRRTGGTGLGLAIVKHAVQRHGGEVRLWSRLGQGSTFTIRLPRAEPRAAPRGRSKKARKNPKKTADTARKDSVA
ncbi:two-component sensor histidine kinase [Microbacterium sp. SYP-A9085]|uniref:sensor histidine kinase n=1 Tax=Microbacterium sp. SYP-A9085 TaxID=2664454 RepID=UPI00129BAC27|nr:ATP-binding protein [Microbacterium sp. SYP-A9085]MRH29411.1 two-component sensor histidine kinase [Microbacterium sp. SYP-A9085]